MALTVDVVTERSKAEAADLRPGDVIVAINGESAAGMLHAEAQSKIRQSSSPLRLLLDRSSAASPGQTNGESSVEVLATRSQGGVRTHRNSQFSLRSSSSSPASLSPTPSSPSSTLPPTSPQPLPGEALFSRSFQNLTLSPGPAADRLSHEGRLGSRQAGRGRAGDSAVLVLPPSRSISPRLSVDLLGEDSEVFKMLQENREGRAPPRQSSSFRLLQEALEAEERGGTPASLPSLLSPQSSLPTSRALATPPKLHTCEKCNTSIANQAVRIQEGRYRHPGCYTCADCGLNLKMRGHFWMGQPGARLAAVWYPASPARIDGSQTPPVDSWKEDGELSGLERQVPVLKLASRDSGVEMAVGDSPLTSSLGLSQDSLDCEPMRCPGSPATESSAHLGRLRASRKLEQVLERSRWRPASPAGWRRHCCSSGVPKELRTCEKHLFGAGEQEANEAGLEEAEVAGGWGPEAWACLPGQGLRYLEHLCLVLEQMARLQQLCLQLQARRPPGNPAEEVEPAPVPSHDPGSEGRGPWEQLSQTEETGAKAASPPQVRVPRANSRRLSEAPAEPAHTFPSSQGHRARNSGEDDGVLVWSRTFVLAVVTAVLGNSARGTLLGGSVVTAAPSAQLGLSHWNKVKVLLSRIRWRNHRHPAPPADPDDPAPRTESGDFPERPLSRPHRKTFMPSLTVKKQRAKNL
ncbi:PDZ and LIM domain protein 2, partial [Galemys pyrenaicus]